MLVMKSFENPILSLSAPFLIIVALIGILQRNGSDRLQTLPALLAGIGLIISGAIERRKHRKKLLMEISNRHETNH